MASSYSTSYFLELMETGANASTWGTNTNNNLKIVDAYGTRVTNVSVSSGTSNVASANASGSLSDAAAKILQVAGSLTGDATITIPNVEGNYLIDTTNVTLNGNSLRVAPYGHTSNFVELNANVYAWVYITGNQAYNGFSKFGDITINGDISNVTGNVTITGNTSITGNATVNSNISVSGSVIADLDFSDNVAARFGDSQDLQLEHDGTDSFITNATNDLYIRNNANDKDVLIQSDNGSGGTATYIQADGSTGAVNLNHLGSTKLATTSSGIDVTGQVAASSKVLSDNNIVSGLNSGGAALTVNDGGGNANLTFNHENTTPEQDGNSGRITVNTDSSSDAKLEIELASNVVDGVSPTMITAATFSDTDQELYHSGSKKLNTTSSGIHVVGDVETDDGTIGNIAVRNLFTTTSTSTPSNGTGSNGDFYLIHD